MIYRGVCLLGSLLSSIVISAQSTNWVDLMMNPGTNYNAVYQSYENYWKTHQKVKHSGHVQFERWRRYVDPYVRPDGTIQSRADVVSTMNAYQHKNASRSAQGNWEEIGPWQERKYTQGVGRLSALAEHPTQPNTLFIGAPAGGVWKTENGGASWQNMDDEIADFGVSYLIFDHSDPNTLFAATGDINTNRVTGRGVYRSTDGGQTWLPSNKGIESETVGKVLQAPNDPNVLICITKTGIFKSTDKGQNWVKKSVTRDFRDLEIKPNDPNIWYASNWSGSGTSAYLYVSKDQGETWTIKNVFNGLYPDSRYEIEISKAEPNKLYLLGGNRMVYSINDGDSFKLMHSGGSFLVNYDDQGWYNAAFEVSDFNPKIMYSGNVRMFKSEDGGLTWLRVNHTHADNHYIKYSKDGKKLYVLDDGGVYQSKDEARTFENLTNIGISQIYLLDQSPFDPNHTLTGYQDCGSKYFDGYQWHTVYGADGMQPLYDHFDSTRFYTSFQYGGIVRHLNGIGSAQSIPKADRDYRGSWITPYLLDAKDPETMYCGGQQIWRTKNLHANRTRDIKWEKISNGVAENVNGYYVRIKLHQANSKRMYALKRVAGHSRTRLIKCDNIYDSIPKWDDLSANYPFTRLSSDFETDPNDSLAIYLLSNNDVLVSRDGGNSFTNFSGTLPDIPLSTIKLDTVTGALYLGARTGVFYRGANDTDWTPFSSGLSKNAEIVDLDIYYHPTDHKLSRLKAATYGRGLWQSDLAGASGIKEPAKCYITSTSKTYSYQDKYLLNLSFKAYLDIVPVTGFAQSDVQVNNGIITSFQKKGDAYEVGIQANGFGAVTVSVADGVAIDAHFNQGTLKSNTWKIEYLEPEIALGIDGPGGVGDSLSIVYWMRADQLMLDANGDTIKTDGQKIDTWFNFMGKDYRAVQTVDSSRPFYRLDTAGINGWPVVEFTPPNRFLQIRDITPVGKSISAFAVAKSNTDNWTGHSWIGNSREANGFLMHNNNNGKTIYGSVLDENRSYYGTPSLEMTSVKEPHVFGLQTDFVKWKNHFQVDHQLAYDYIEKDIVRDGNDTITMRLGKDYGERYGNGKLAEMVYFKTDIKETKRVIISNYLAAKYGVDLLRDERYFYSATHPYEVAGIGQVDALDKHLDAKGTGLLRVQSNGLNDHSFLMWGHNNGILEQWKPSDLQDEMIVSDLQWRTAVTGTIGVVKVLIEKDQVNLTKGKLGLLVGTTKTYDNAVVYELTDNGTHYEAEVTFSNGDFVTLAQADRFTVGISSDPAIKSIRLYPNPSLNGSSTLQFLATEAGLMNIQIMNVKGERIQQQQSRVESGVNEIQLDLTREVSGVYIVRVVGAQLNESYRLIVW